MATKTVDKVAMFLAELIGTAMLIFIGCMGCLSWNGQPPSSLQSSFTFGMVVMLIIQTFGCVSGSVWLKCLSFDYERHIVCSVLFNEIWSFFTVSQGTSQSSCNTCGHHLRYDFRSGKIDLFSHFFFFIFFISFQLNAFRRGESFIRIE